MRHKGGSPVTTPRISAIICTRNRAPILEKVLAHLATLETPEGFPWELIVVDNGSTDHTREVVAHAPLAIRYVNEPAAGHSIALNTGVRHARADVIAFTDDDAFPARDWLKTIAQHLMTGDADWVFGPVDPLWPGDVPDWYGQETGPLIAAIDYGSEPFVAEHVHLPFVGVNHAGRKSLLDSLGGYREDCGARGNVILGIGNDEDLYRRLLAANARLVYDPRMRVKHCISEARCTKSFHRRWIKASARGFARYLRGDRPFGERAIPRWMLRKPFDHAVSWLGATFRHNKSAAFYHEIQLRRFVNVLWSVFFLTEGGGPL